MRVVVHVGMPKAGSTAMQETLAANREEMLREHGIDYWQADDEPFPNHNSLYESLNEEDWDEARRRAHELLNHAILRGASVCLISNEMLLLLADRPAILERLPSIFGPGARVEYLIYLRDFRKFLRSYLLQLFANGTFNVEDDQLARFYCDLVRNYAQSGSPCTIINYEKATAESDVLAELVRHCSGHTPRVAAYKANVSPSRPAAHYALAGIVCRLTAVSRNVHVNSGEIDKLRLTMEALYDDDPQLRATIDQYEKLLAPAVDRYIEVALAALSDEQRKFLAAQGHDLSST